MDIPQLLACSLLATKSDAIIATDRDGTATRWVPDRCGSAHRLIGVCRGARGAAATLLWDGRRRRSERIGRAKNRKSASEVRYVRGELCQTDAPLLTDARKRASFRNAGWPHQVSVIRSQ